ncbi:MAG: hypothetical protein O2923_13895 [Verrucomicrobia bacterium]|nr:hypothetical protein [Verrucomicrobiota bacterium]MDA1088516.1 hypothetical protein [Verrucomicrobiota bacterium]
MKAIIPDLTATVGQRDDAQNKTAILIEPGVRRVTRENNQLEDFALDVDDRRLGTSALQVRQRRGQGRDA